MRAPHEPVLLPHPPSPSSPRLHNATIAPPRHDAPGSECTSNLARPPSIPTLSTDHHRLRAEILLTASEQPPNLNEIKFRSMGWLKPKPSSTPEVAYQSNPTDRKHNATTIVIRSSSSSNKCKDEHKSSAQHLERIDSHHDNSSSSTGEPLLYHFQPKHLKDIDLPFIPSTTVLKAAKILHRVWIVVDNIVYDCTTFLHEHPGGNTVIESFAGQDCSWQFWRFHNRQHMRDSGLGLRVGRTEGVKNLFAERARFVGLRKLDVWN
jgi:cytochrome b involved in lipid metabolism